MTLVVFLALQLVFAASFRYAYSVSLKSGGVKVGQSKIKYSRKALAVLFAAYVIYIVAAVFRAIGEYGLGGMDAVGYMNFFQATDCSLKTFFSVMPDMASEPGYRLFVWSLGQLFDDYRVFLFIVHSIVFFCIAHFNRYWVVRKESVVSFLCTMLVCSELIYAFSGIRNTLAIAVALVFFALIDDKKFLAALLVALVAISIHFSSMILLVVWATAVLLHWRKVTTFWQSSLAVGLMLVFTGCGIPVVNLIFKNTKYAFYLSGGSLALGVCAFMFVMTVAMLLRFGKLKKTPYTTMDMWVLLTVWCAVLLQANFAIMYRTLMFFLPVAYKLVPEMYANLPAEILSFDQEKRKLNFLPDRLLGEKLTAKNFYKPSTYYPLIFLGLKVAMAGYLVLRLYETFTVDYVSYGIYQYQLML